MLFRSHSTKVYIKFLLWLCSPSTGYVTPPSSYKRKELPVPPFLWKQGKCKSYHLPLTSNEVYYLSLGDASWPQTSHSNNVLMVFSRCSGGFVMVS